MTTLPGLDGHKFKTPIVMMLLTKFPKPSLRQCRGVRLLFVFIAGLWLAACSAPRKPDVSPSLPARTDTGMRAAEVATRMIGAPYHYGASGPASFDCSGLVQYSYAIAGVRVPRTSLEQLRAAAPIRLSDAQPGDLLFFRYDGRVSHVGIYLGDLRFVHAPSNGKQVEVASLQDPHYQQHFMQAGRLQ